MTVAELINKLENLPPETRVVVYDDEYSAYIEIKEITYKMVYEIQNEDREVISHGAERAVVI